MVSEASTQRDRHRMRGGGGPGAVPGISRKRKEGEGMFTRQAVRREMYSGSKGGVGNRIACSPSLEYAAEELVRFARVPPFTAQFY